MKGRGEGRTIEARSTPLVLCADDYGMNPGVSEAILDLARTGRLSALSCMTGMPHWPDAASGLSGLGPGVGIGLHLTFTEAPALGPVPGLTTDGVLPSVGRLIALSVAGRLPRAAIEAEIERQLDRFEAAAGRMPDFVDGHQHVQVLPGIRAALLAVLTRRSLAGRLWLRDPSDRVASILARRLSAPKALLIAGFAAGFRKAARNAGFETNEGFSGFSPFDPAREPERDFAATLRRVGPRHLTMCHPGLPDPTGGPDAIAPARLAEYRYLSSPAFGELMAERGIVLVPRPV